jgi:hypothetical protein
LVHGLETREIRAKASLLARRIRIAKVIIESIEKGEAEPSCLEPFWKVLLE